MEKNTKPIQVLLCCGAGLSSGFLAQGARKVAKKKGLDIKIEAKSETEAVLYLPKIDVLLLAPHYENFKAKFTELAKPYNVAVGVIPRKSTAAWMEENSSSWQLNYTSIKRKPICKGGKNNL